MTVGVYVSALELLRLQAERPEGSTWAESWA